MKLLIDTEWAVFAQDLSPEKELELYRAILNFPNSDCSLKCWSKIKPILETGMIKYFNKINNLKKGGITEHIKNKTDIGSDTERNTDSVPIRTPNGNINNNINNNIQENKKDLQDKAIAQARDFEDDFMEFWAAYTPVKCDDGKFVSKGDKKPTMEKYISLRKAGANHGAIMKGLQNYLSFCAANNSLTCGALVFLNQRRWQREYEQAIIAVPPKNKSLSGEIQTNAILTDFIKNNQEENKCK